MKTRLHRRHPDSARRRPPPAQPVRSVRSLKRLGGGQMRVIPTPITPGSAPPVASSVAWPNLWKNLPQNGDQEISTNSDGWRNTSLMLEGEPGRSQQRVHCRKAARNPTTAGDNKKAEPSGDRSTRAVGNHRAGGCSRRGLVRALREARPGGSHPPCTPEGLMLLVEHVGDVASTTVGPFAVLPVPPISPMLRCPSIRSPPGTAGWRRHHPTVHAGGRMCFGWIVPEAFIPPTS